MVESLAFNRAHQADSVALFECGKVFFPAADGVGECLHLCLGTYGARKRAHLDGQRPTTSDEAFLNLKGELESVFRMLRVLEDIRFEACEYAGLTPGQAARVIFKQNEIGRIGILDSSLLERRKLVGPVALAELSLQPLLPSKRRMAKMKPIPAFPAITRDVALIVDRCRTHQEVVDQVQQNRPRDLEQFEVFDVFESDKLGKNRKSMAYRFVYRNANKTLTDKAVEKMHSQLVDRLVEALQAEISGR
jgi:phenylalanyl-tRNA synthetase beta chain